MTKKAGRPSESITLKEEEDSILRKLVNTLYLLQKYIDDIFKTTNWISKDINVSELEPKQLENRFIAYLMGTKPTSVKNFYSKHGNITLSKDSIEHFRSKKEEIVRKGENLKKEENSNKKEDKGTLDKRVLIPQIRSYYNTVNGIIENKQKHLKLNGASNKLFVNNQTTLTEFFSNNNVWICWERTEKKISKRWISFLRGNNNELVVTMSSADHDDNTLWKGKGYIEGTEKYHEYLIINLRSEDNKSRYATHIMLKVDSHKDKNKTKILIGHVMFEHTRHWNVVTKTIILQLPYPDNDNIQEINDHKCEFFDLNNSHIPPPIRYYLADRSLNRLSSPHSNDASIFNLEDLTSWHEKNILDIYGAVNTYNKIQGLYKLIYFKGKGSEPTNLVIDSLFISDISHPNLSATYNHLLEDNTLQECEGKVQLNDIAGVLSIFLDSSKDDEKMLVSEPVFVMFKIPPKGQSWDTLLGLIAGDKDGHQGPISCLSMIVKVQNKGELNTHQTSIIKHFFEIYKIRAEHNNPLEISSPTNIFTFLALEKWVKSNKKD